MNFWDTAPVNVKIRLLEQYLAKHSIFYRTPLIYMNDAPRAADAVKLVVFKYTPLATCRRPGGVEFWPVVAGYFGRRSCVLTTGIWHDSWAYPIYTNDILLSHKPTTNPNAKPPTPEAVDFFFTQLPFLFEAHKSRIIMFRKGITDRVAHDLYLSLLRSGAVGKRSKTKWFSLFLLLPPFGDKWTLLDHIAVITNHLEDMDAYLIGSLLGKLADHLVQGIEPITQRRLVFRPGEKREGANESLRWKNAHPQNRGKFFAGEAARNKNKQLARASAEANREEPHDSDDSAVGDGIGSLFQHDFASL